MNPINIDWNTVSIIGSFLIGGLGFVFAVKSDVKILGNRIDSIEKTVDRVASVIVPVAQHEVMIGDLNKRFDQLPAKRWNGNHTS